MPQQLTQTKKIIEILWRGGVGILPTDTLYGIVGSALSRKTVARIYHARHRNPKKPMIILMGDVKDLVLFGIRSSPQIKKILKRVWPGKVSDVLPLPRHAAILKKFQYLHRGTRTLAFRLPAKVNLRALLRQIGPLVAPSANFEGMPPAKTIRAAKKYFGTDVDCYLDIGRRDAKPSTVIKIERGRVIVLRKGG